MGVLVLSGRVHLDRPGEQVLAAVRSGGQLPEQKVVFGSGGHGVQTFQLDPPDYTEMEVRAEEGGTQMRVDTSAVPDHHRLQMLLLQLSFSAARRNDKLRIFVTFLSRALPSVGMYFLYMRCHSIISLSLSVQSQYYLEPESTLFVEMLVIYFVFMEIWRRKPRKDSLFSICG